MVHKSVTNATKASAISEPAGFCPLAPLPLGWAQVAWPPNAVTPPKPDRRRTTTQGADTGRTRRTNPSEAKRAKRLDMIALSRNRGYAKPMGLSCAFSAIYGQMRSVLSKKEADGASPVNDSPPGLPKLAAGAVAKPSEANGVKSHEIMGLNRNCQEAKPMGLSVLFSTASAKKWPVFHEKQGLRSMRTPRPARMVLGAPRPAGGRIPGCSTRFRLACA